MPYKKIAANEWDTESTLQHAAQRIRDWASQDGDISRGDAGVELAEMFTALVQDREGGALSYKSAVKVFFDEMLGSE